MDLMESLQECAERLHEIDRRMSRLERVVYVILGFGIGTGMLNLWELVS